VSTAERKRRFQDVARIRGGELPSPLTADEQFELLCADAVEQCGSRILHLRNKQRASLGWPLLNGDGRENPPGENYND
jgi:hypothetical protein